MPLDLRPAASQTAAIHERFLEETLPPSLSLEAFAAFDASRYADEDVLRGRASWQLRTLDEHRSLAAFADLLALLLELGAAIDLIGTAARVVRDEDRHVELCRRMVRALGGDDVIPGTPTSTTPREMSPRGRLLHHVAGSLCVGETFSMRVLAALRGATDDALAREVVEQIARDESVHSRFGWLALEAILLDLDDEGRAELQAVVTRSLASARVVVAGAVGQRHPFGSLDGGVRARVIEETSAEVEHKMRALGVLA